MLFKNKKRNNLYNEIIFKRGYIISKGKRIKPPHKHWKHKKINDIHIYYDPLNTVNSVKSNKSWVFVLGTIIDINRPNLRLDEISKLLLNYLNESEVRFFKYLDYLSGRYFILYNDSIETKILSDATGMRSIFYSKDKDIIASHCKLANEYVHASENTLVKEEWLGEYSNYHLPGHYTPYKNILFLTPNTLLCITTKEIKRFFPREPLEETSVNESANKISLYVNNQVSELVKRYEKLLLSLSAGIDSRTSLSFTKDYRDKFTYFTYSKENYKELNSSIKVLQVDKQQVQDMVSSLGLNHRFITIDENIDIEKTDQTFYSAIQNNTYTNHSFLLAKKYYEHFGEDYLHIRTNITEIGQNFYDRTKKAFKKFTVSAMVHAYSPNAVNNKGVYKAFENFYNEVGLNKIYNYDPFSLFYWEYRMGIWHTQLLLESDVAHDTYILFNAREILKNFLSIPSYDINEQTLFYELINKNWPILNHWKINQIGNLSEDIDSQIEDYGLNLSNLLIKSGSKYDHNKFIPLYSKIKKKQAKFFMGIGNPRKGDFIDAELTLETLKEISYYCIVQVRSPYENRKNRRRLKYQILLNGELLLEEDISDWKESNHIHIKWVSQKGRDTLTIRTVAVKNCEDWGWGRAAMMYVERIVLREEQHDTLLEVSASSPYSTIIND